ncbi:hypothetical protein BC940DRAFT_303053 [Gongronella butleri]|nr:hypothetical protein BC940DRAFT_303053 [Gongronella butleri]
MTTTAPKLSIRPSATLIIAAPLAGKTHADADYRVLMMKRNGRSSFSHAYAYPGGVVDKEDAAPLWRDMLKDTTSSDSMLTHKICAIRETFEESGLLLTHPPAHTVQELDLDTWKHRVHDDATLFKQMCEQYKLVPAVDKLIPVANWITPAMEKKRFNTLFFLTVLPTAVDDKINETSKVAADGKETVRFDWFKPSEALANYEAKKIVLFPPQWYTLHLMDKVRHHGDLGSIGLGTVRMPLSGLPITIRPQFHFMAGNDDADLATDERDWKKNGYDGFLVYPGDARYTMDDTDAQNDLVPWSNKLVQPQHRHRVYFKGKMQEFCVFSNIKIQELLSANL